MLSCQAVITVVKFSNNNYTCIILGSQSGRYEEIYLLGYNTR
jgi:hypothetical protein